MHFKLPPNTHVHYLLSLTHACPPQTKPVSLAVGGTLFRQASMPCKRQHFVSGAPPSSHGPAPQTDDLYILGYDPAGTHTDALTNLFPVLPPAVDSRYPRQGKDCWTGMFLSICSQTAPQSQFFLDEKTFPDAVSA